MKIFPINTTDVDEEIRVASNKLSELKQKRKTMESNQLFQCSKCDSFSTLSDLILIIQQILVDDVYTQHYKDGAMGLICPKCNSVYCLYEDNLRFIPEIFSCGNVLKVYKTSGYIPSWNLYKYNGQYEKYPGRDVTKEEILGLLGVIV